MNRFIYKITPSFIHYYNNKLLKNSPLGWQLQLPVITWLWLLITLVTVPLPSLYTLDINGSDDIVGTIMISALIGIIEFFLFGYILIQFNNTKSFGKKAFLNGLKEQLAYLYVLLLCLEQIILFPLIVDYRKGHYMTEQEIRQEAKVFNKAMHYFMDDPGHYKYFQSKEAFEKYMHITYTEHNSTESLKESYYRQNVMPFISPYFEKGTERLEPQYTRDAKVPVLLCVSENDFLIENYSSKYDFYVAYDPGEEESISEMEYYMYQFDKKTDTERLKDIRAFIKLYTYYQNIEYSGNNLVFDSPEETLGKYRSNQFDFAVHETYPSLSSNSFGVINNYVIERVHSIIMESKFERYDKMLLRFLICFHIAFVFSVLLFLFKNNRLKELILLFVYSALLALLVIILTVTMNLQEHLGIHVVIAVFFTGIYFSFIDPDRTHFSSVKTIFIMLSNLTIAYAPIFFFIYFYEYHDLWKMQDDECGINNVLCNERRALMDVVEQVCLFGGLVLYICAGSVLYKKVYERVRALPMDK